MFTGILILLALAPPAKSLDELESQGYTALRENDLDRVREIASTIDEQFPDNFNAAMASGSLLLRAGIAKESLIAFDRAAELQPRQVPYMWQRGIAQYYAGEHEAGRKQFVVHREVNANDVENAVWHFMCVARLNGLEAARKAYLPAPGDPRPPLQEVYDLFAGTASIDDVTRAMARFPSDSPAGVSANFYGELYLGMYEDIRGNLPEAESWLRKASARPLTSYMADIARVHLQHVLKQRQSAVESKP
ncbi:MAG: tetratricopeptide repeat protein [Pirellulaceae bacterium]